MQISGRPELFLTTDADFWSSGIIFFITDTDFDSSRINSVMISVRKLFCFGHFWESATHVLQTKRQATERLVL